MSAFASLGRRTVELVVATACCGSALAQPTGAPPSAPRAFLDGRMPRILRSWTALAVLAGAVVVTVAAQDAQRTVRDRVFSAAQAARGEQLFESICMNCHEIAEFTAAGAYLDDVEGKPLWETFEYVWAEMPEDEPASLNPEDYAAVLAYIFSIYGLPSGATDLPTDRESLEEITITRPALPGS